MLSLETIEWFSTHFYNDKVIDYETKPVERSGWIVNRMTDILHTETFFQHTMRCLRTDFPVESFLRSDTMNGYACTWKVKGNRAYLIIAPEGY